MPYNSKYFLFATAGALLFTFLLVGVRRSVAVDIIVPTDYPTIQGAIDKASTGDTVIVDDGLYKENIVIGDAIVLRSKNGSEKTFVEPVEAKSDIIRVLEVPGGVTITGFTLSGSLAAGLYIIKSPGSRVFNNISTANNYGVQVEHSPGSIVKENALNVNDTGLYLLFSDECVVEGNDVSRNTNAGILLHSSHKSTLTENEVNRNMWNGITLSSSNDNIVKANNALKNTYAIVVSESSGNMIDGNSTMPRLYYILPVALIYLAIMLYMIERKAFSIYYKYKYGE
jgi:parallel beta-helix repeat protein